MQRPISSVNRAQVKGVDRSSCGLDCHFRPLSTHAIGDFGSDKDGGGPGARTGRVAPPAALQQEQAQPEQQQQAQKAQHAQQVAAAAAAGAAPAASSAASAAPSASAEQVRELQAKLAELSGPAARNARKRLQKRLAALQPGAEAT
jgi:hypothetical protein